MKLLANNETVNSLSKVNFQILIAHKQDGVIKTQLPNVESQIKWETHRQGSPGKLTFRVHKDANLNFQPGDVASLYSYPEDEKIANSNDLLTKGTLLFWGYVFTKKRNKDGWIEVTAYDALRYLKNKDTITYTNKKASEVVSTIAKNWTIPVGKIEDTNYVIGSRVEDDQSLIDILQNAIDLTLISTNTLYVLYMDQDKICLENAINLRKNVVIDDTMLEDYDYTTTIDEDVYNEIELYYDDDKTNKRQYFNVRDSANIEKWYRLKYTENIQTPTNGQQRAEQMLKLYNQLNRKIQLKNVFGNPDCKAGSSVTVKLNLGDMILDGWVRIEKAVHTITKDEYMMDLTVSSREFAV